MLTEFDVLFRDATNQAAFAEIRKMPKGDQKKALDKHIKKMPNDAQALVNNHMSRKKAKDAKNALLQTIDWSKWDDITKTWPSYIQAVIEAEKNHQNLRKSIEIPSFDLRIPFSQQYLLQGAALTLESGKRICLHGEPGTGKSTLFDAISNGSNEGGIKGFPNHIHVHLCHEIEISSDAQPVLDTVVNSFEFLYTLRQNRVAVVKRLIAITGKTPPTNVNELNATSNVPDVEPTDKPSREGEAADLMSNLKQIDQRLESLGNRDAEERASKMLRVLGFDDEKQRESTNALSGGLRMRVALCAAFFMEPDLLLLDEPTNHLDFPSVLWLENRMRAYRKTLLLVSHERDMLERVCTSVIDICKKNLVYYQMGFGAFEKKLEDDEKNMAVTVEKFLSKNRNIDSASPLARQKKEYQDWQDEYYAKQIRLQGKFTFPPAVPLAGFILEGAGENKLANGEVAPAPVVAAPVKKGAAKKTTSASDENTVDLSTYPRADIIFIDTVRFSYNPGVLPWIFDAPISFTVTYSPFPTRVGVMGPNGAGKSTFLKLLTGRLTPVSGKVTRNDTAKIGYFAQHHAAELDMSLTPMEYLKMQFPNELNSGVLRKHLAKVGVTGTLAETRMKSLTHGQRSCVMFAKITFDCPHLLIMDEPTNFLDLASIDSLIAATNRYDGALLLVSHNRGFLLKCARQYLSIVPGQFNLYNDLKSCEMGTYTFIQELESGGFVSGSSLLANTAKHTKAGAEEFGEKPAEEAAKPE